MKTKKANTGGEGCFWLVVFIVGLTVVTGGQFWTALLAGSAIAGNILLIGLAAIVVAGLLINLTK